MSRPRIESLLASFPKLIPTGTQHTSVETADVRYVYQPLEDLYIVLITNRASNILQDIDTLHLFARVVSDMCRSAEEREILKSSFELLGAFDEIVSLGYRENVNLMQVRSVLEMESHEEKIQEIIARNKEAEAKEELKRRAKQLEMQRREQQRRAASGGGGGSGGYMGGMGGGVTGYSPVPQRYETETPTPARTASPAPSTLRPPAFKGSGMKLGSKKIKQSEILDALGGEVTTPDEGLSAASTPVLGAATAAPAKDLRSILPAVHQETVHIVVREQVSASIKREGGLTSLELRGDMNLHITDAALARVKLVLGEPPVDFGSELQFKQHPNVAKFAPGVPERVVALKDPSRPFPVKQSLAVLKWRYSGKDETLLPLSINCWPTPSNDGKCEVNIEYELENQSLTLHDLLLSIPLPSGSYPTVTSHSGDWTLNASTHSLDWSIALVSADETSGALEFSVGGDDVTAFFPVNVSFVAVGSVAGVSVARIARVDNDEEVVFSQDASAVTEDFFVV